MGEFLSRLLLATDLSQKESRMQSGLHAYTLKPPNYREQVKVSGSLQEGKFPQVSSSRHVLGKYSANLSDPRLNNQQILGYF